MSATEKKTGEKKNFFEPIVHYLKEVRGELRKVVFPTFKQVRKNTTVVIIVVIIVGLIIAGLDLMFDSARNYFIKTNTTTNQTIPQGSAQQVPSEQQIPLEGTTEQQTPQQGTPGQQIPQQGTTEQAPQAPQAPASEGSNQ